MCSHYYGIYKHYRNKASSEIRKVKKAATGKLATKLTYHNIGVGRFRILGARFRILGGGANRGQMPSRHMTS